MYVCPSVLPLTNWVRTIYISYVTYFFVNGFVTVLRSVTLYSAREARVTTIINISFNYIARVLMRNYSVKNSRFDTTKQVHGYGVSLTIIANNNK